MNELIQKIKENKSDKKIWIEKINSEKQSANIEEFRILYDKFLEEFPTAVFNIDEMFRFFIGVNT